VETTGFERARGVYGSLGNRRLSGDRSGVGVFGRFPPLPQPRYERNQRRQNRILMRRPALPGQFLKQPDPSTKSSYTTKRIPPRANCGDGWARRTRARWPCPGCRQQASSGLVASSTSSAQVCQGFPLRFEQPAGRCAPVKPRGTTRGSPIAWRARSAKASSSLTDCANW
jgi:hypothetical protein